MPNSASGPNFISSTATAIKPDAKPSGMPSANSSSSPNSKISEINPICIAKFNYTRRAAFFLSLEKRDKRINASNFLSNCCIMTFNG